MQKTDHGEFIMENDTVRISYSFNGKNAPVLIGIYNKSNEPLYIDWQKSVLVINDVATSYMEQNVALSGSIEKITVNQINNLYTLDVDPKLTFGNFSGTATLPQNISFVAPKSKIEYCKLKFNNLDFNRIKDSEFAKSKMTDKNHLITNIKTKEFDETNSPLKFRSYLTLYVGSQFNAVGLDQSFYLSNLIKSGSLNPYELPNELAERKDMFYIGGDTF